MYTNATLLSLPPTPPFETQQETRSDLWSIKPTLLCNEARLDTWQLCTALQAAHARRRRCRCRRRNPARVAPAKKAETMRYDTTRHHSCIQAGSPATAQRTSAFSRSADFRFSAAHEQSLDLGRCRFKDRPDCVVLPASHI